MLKNRVHFVVTYYYRLNVVPLSGHLYGRAAKDFPTLVDARCRDRGRRLGKLIDTFLRKTMLHSGLV